MLRLPLCLSTKKTRYIYKGELARPLRNGQLPEEKLAFLYADLGVSTDTDALLALAVQHISGFQRKGPKSRAYPSGPLRWHLKDDERPEDKLPLLYSHLGVSNQREAVLALAAHHVPGFRRAVHAKTGGRKGMSARRRSLGAYEACADGAWMCDIIDMIREDDPHAKLFKIAYDLSHTKPEPGYENPAYDLQPEWIVQRYTNRKRYDESAQKRFTRGLHQLRALLLRQFRARLLAT